MSSKPTTIDPTLRYLQDKTRRELARLDQQGLFGLEVAREQRRIEPHVKVLVQYRHDLAALQAAGLNVRTVAGDVVSGVIHFDHLPALAALPNVVRVESSRPLTRELDLSVPAIGANSLHAAGLRGRGVIIGIVDTGIDFRHPTFRAADGRSRILAIWDQRLRPQGGETSPAHYDYGVEYTQAQIDAALGAEPPAVPVRHVDIDGLTGHGTHVAGIAAGRGAPVGVAPEANLVIVINRVDAGNLGDSSQSLDAINYLLAFAAARQMPLVINLSQGDNIGPHDGSSLLERGIDNLVGGPGVVVVKSAGNEAGSGRHASGRVSPDAPLTLTMLADRLDTNANVIDLWYAAGDRLAVALTSPDGTPTPIVEPGASAVLTLPNGNIAYIDSELGDGERPDNHIYITVERSTAATIAAGRWQLTLHPRAVTDGRFHAWVQLSMEPTFFFDAPYADDACTITIPGTSPNVITVGAYISRGAPVGALSAFSSQGPTRSGLLKPDLCAPGESITSARAAQVGGGPDLYHLLAGTSMAAPHVAGAAALLLQLDPSLTQAQVLALLRAGCRADGFTGDVPNNRWGAGKLDVPEAARRLGYAEEEAAADFAD